MDQSPSSEPPGAPAGSLQWIGTATVIVRYGPFAVLTDPNFLHKGQHAYLGHGLTARRLTEPALSPDQLPPLDAVVLSHLHGDHWDRVARRTLARDTTIVTTPHASRRLQAWHGFHGALGLRTWASHTLVKDGATLKITALPGRHAHGVIGALLPPVMGSMLEFSPPAGEVAFRIYLSGDTLFYDALREIPRRYPDIPLALLHLGATTLPGGFMVTMDHRQGCDLVELLRPKRAVPIHLDDYGLFRFDPEAFRREVDQRGLQDVVVHIEPGTTVPLPLS